MTDKNNSQIMVSDEIRNRIFTIDGVQVMIDRDLAELYQVSTKRLKEQVKRNIKRFPAQFCFQLDQKEKSELVANCDRLEKLKHSSTLPSVFTEQGVAMLSAVLHSDTAIKVSIQIISAFVEMRKFISDNAQIFRRLDKIEHKLTESDDKFDTLFKALAEGNPPKNKGIFFNGQIFDAHIFVSEIIQSAKSTIRIVDNYIDDSVLTLLSSKKSGVVVHIYTSKISKQISLSIDKFNQQYPTLNIHKFQKSHDRFIIIDDSHLYHIGASLKDLGKKVFAFSKMDSQSIKILNLLKL